MKSKASVKRTLQILNKLYPQDGKCFLNYETPWQLLFATILSAQCTDDRVNKVTATLFKEFPDLEAFAEADIAALENAVRQTGFFRMKAKHLQESARILILNHSKEMPSCIDELTKLSGVGRKTANVVRGHIFGIPSIVVDTHVKRISNKLGMAKSHDPVKIEQELMEILPKKSWIAYNQQVITHGRNVCVARSPKCTVCELISECAWAKAKKS